MTNTEAFIDAMNDVGLKFKILAKKVGLTPNGLRKKVHNQSEFKASEIQKCTEIMHLTSEERDYIFLSEQ